MFWCSVTTKITIVVTIGLGFALTAVISFLFLPYIIEYNVKQKLVLSPNSMTFNGWQRTSIPIYTEFYLFNVTNPDSILSEHKNPILEEIGPYTFRESSEKVNITWNEENGTVSYKQIKRWIFVSEKTNGSLDDQIIHLNVPMISAGNNVMKSSRDPDFYYEALNVIIEESKSLIFKKNTVRELLFEGYDEILLKAAKQLFPETPFTRFGWFYLRNNTSTDGNFSIFTGEKEINKLGLLQSWNSQNSLSKWFGKECQRIEGVSAGDFQPPFRSPEPSHIEIFAGDMCRPFKLDFAHKVDYNGIECNRYWLSPSLFDYSLPENRCYCEDSCPRNGVLNVSVCTMGSPTAISFPHFLYADKSYLESVDGLTPSPLKHSFYMDFENSLGIPLNIAARLQVNIVVERNENLDFSKNMTKKQLYFPQFWFSTTARVGEDVVQQLNFLLNGVPLYTKVISFLFLLIGFLLIISAAICGYRTKRMIRLNQRQKYKAVELISTTSDH